MPITQGAGNPNWTRDETILALDLLYRHGSPIHKGHADIKELSALLRSALIHPPEKQLTSFRNEDGVALKLQNLQSAIDPSRGLSSSTTDRAMVDEYPRSRATELALIALSIRQAIISGETPEPAPDDEVFTEGQLLTTRHRQRDSRLRKKLLAKKTDDQLVCSLCDFSAPPLCRPLQESFYEAHHIRPLAESNGPISTRVADMALLCANCHRFIHKLISTRRRWFSIDEARSELGLID